MTTMEQMVEAGARAAAFEACSAHNLEEWVDANWPKFVGEVEAALRAALPRLGEDIAKALDGLAITAQEAGLDISTDAFGEAADAVRSRLSEIMEGK